MSVWTHITGNIRIDGLPGVSPLFTVEGIKEMLGNTCSFDDDRDIWDKCSVPKGSEGSLQYEVIEYSGGLPWITVAVWGDLRDYDDVDEIKKWFEGIVCQKEIMTRQAVLNVSVNGGSDVVLVLHEDDETKTVKLIDIKN